MPTSTVGIGQKSENPLSRLVMESLNLFSISDISDLIYVSIDVALGFKPCVARLCIICVVMKSRMEQHVVKRL